MSIRLTGMASGLDTESMIADLMSAYKGTKQKKVSTMTKYSWKMEAWSSLNKKINDFYSKSLSSLRFSSSYSMKKTSVSDPAKASVTASSGAVVGSQTLAVRQLAQSGYLTGGKLSKVSGNMDEGIDGDTTMAELGFTSENAGKITVSGGDGEYHQISIDKSTTVSGLVKQLKDAGIEANFDQKNGRIFVSSKSTGLSGDFELQADNTEGIDALKKLGLYSKAAEGSAEYKSYTKWSNYDFTSLNDDGTLSDADSKAVYDAEIASRVAAYKQNIVDADDAIDKANKTIAEQQKLLNGDGTGKGIVTRLNENSQYTAAAAEVNDLYTRLQNGGEISEAEKEKYGLKDKSAEELKDITEESLMNSALKSRVSDLKKQIKETKDEDAKKALKDQLKDAESAVSDYTDKVKAEKTIASANEEIDKANASKDEASKYITTDAAGIGSPTDLLKSETLQYMAGKADTARSILNGDHDSDITSVRLYGQDAKIYLNGAEFESSTNGFEINGLTINVTGLTGLTEAGKLKSEDQLTAEDFNTVTLTTNNDVDSVYKNIKSFISKYNELIKEMDTKYNAASAKDYDILSDEERDAMSDTEAEAWDKKIKDALLRRDDSLGSMIDTMKAAMQKTYEINGKSYSLSSFGIETMSYFLSSDGEKGVYHIDGDPDDSDTSANVDKLKAMISSDPEAVQEFFSKLTDDMYKTLQGKASSSTNSSYGTFYEDKAMTKQYDKYKTALSDYEKKLADIEDKYYKQFSAMETALTKLQSSTSAITGMFNY